MLNVHVLGESSIWDDESDLRTGSSRGVALVALLALHAGASQPRQRIAGLFWPDSADSQALTNLRRELHYLRRALGRDQSLVVAPVDLRWRDTETCLVDLRIFAREREAALAAAAAGDDGEAVAHAAIAVGQYGGEFLPGMDDEWVVDARLDLERQCAGLCDVLCAARTRTGDLSGATDAARRRIQLEPLEESGYRTLMQLQSELGDRAGAVSTYHRCASVLERELGIAPDAETQQAFHRLMTATATAAGSSAPRPPGPAQSRSAYTAPSFIGRSAEMERLRELWDAARAGQPHLVLVRGSAGVGKTRLVTELAKAAGLEGAVVASSQCFGTGRLALTPVADWIRTPSVFSSLATLDRGWRAEVERLVPSGRHGRSRDSSRAMVDAWRRIGFFEGLARALLVAGRPLLLVLDNIQWCDQETLEFLTFLLGLAPDAQLLIAATQRDDNQREVAALAGWAERMRATGCFAELSLGPFEAVQTAQLMEALAGRPQDREVVELLQSTTGGFPFYVIEAMRGSGRAGVGALPDGDLTAVLRNRLEQVSAPARQVAGLAAAVGRDFGLDLLTEASDLDATAVVSAVDELWRRRILRDVGDAYDFTHDLLRDSAYEQVSPPQRWLLHRRLAQALELLHPDDLDSMSAQIAGQYSRGGRPERAVTYYLRAAGIAAGVFAHTEAIQLYQAALRSIATLPPGHARDRRELAVYEAMAAPLTARSGYASPDLEQTLERCIVLAGSLRSRDSTVIGMASLAASRFVQGRPRDAYQVAKEALALIEVTSELACQPYFLMGGAALSLGRPVEGLRHLELATTLGGGSLLLTVGTRPDVHGMAWAAHAEWLLGKEEPARARSERAVQLARTIDHPYSLAVALAYAAVTDQLRGDLAALRERVTELHTLCERYGFGYYSEWGLILAGWSRSDEGGILSARQGIQGLRSHGAFGRMPYWLSLLADLQARCGRPGAARATLDAATATARVRDDVWWLPEVLRMRAAYDDEGRGFRRLQEAADLASAHRSLSLLWRCERDLEACSTLR